MLAVKSSARQMREEPMTFQSLSRRVGASVAVVCALVTTTTASSARAATPAAAAAPVGAAVFEKPTAIVSNVAFWKKVYAEWRLDDIALHDEDDLGMVYRVVRVPKRGQKDAQGRSRAEAVTQAREEVELALKGLEAKKPKNADELTGLEKEIFTSLAGVDRADKYTRLAKIRGQNGLYERFIQGYANSGLYDRFITDELERNGLPKELIGVAFVESLFFTGAKSKVGAAGVWQFMSYTGKEYMQLNPVVDERWDPILATEAAAKYLKQAKKELGTWPLAVTSYNYGRSGMKQLSKAAGTTDFNTILAVSKNKRFGFAGRNYYASVLAILEILDEKDTRLAGVSKRASWEYDVVRVPFPVFATQLINSGHLDQATFEWLNPALSDEAARGRLPLPHGMSLRVPKDQGAPILAHLQGLPSADKNKAVRAVKLVHTCNGKQSLKDIARQHDLGVDVLAARTGLPTAGALPKGQKVPVPPAMARTSLLPEARALPLPPLFAAPVLLADAVELLPQAVAAPARLAGLGAPTMGLKGAVVVTVKSEALLTSTLPVVDVVAGQRAMVLGDVDVVTGSSSTAPAAMPARSQAVAPGTT